MMKKLLFICVILTFVGVTSIFAQRKSVGGTEVTGIFRNYFGGKFKKFSNEIDIKALGGRKLEISMNLIYPYDLNRRSNYQRRYRRLYARRHGHL
jgi:hypothetical protein